MKFHDVCSVSKGHWMWDKQNSDFIFGVKLGPGDFLLHSQDLISCVAHRHAAYSQQGSGMSPVFSDLQLACFVRREYFRWFLGQTNSEKLVFEFLKAGAR